MDLDPVLQRFFDDASALRLTQDERADARSALAAHAMLAATMPDFHLTAAERIHGKDLLLRYVKAHPLAEVQGHSWIDILSSLVFSRVFAYVFGALFVLGGSGVLITHAAERSLPGDALYGMKVRIIEPFRKRMLQSPEEFAAWKVRTVERRIAEAEALSAAGRVTSENRGIIERGIAAEIDVLDLPATHSGKGGDLDLATAEVLENALESVALSRQEESVGPDPEWDRLAQFVLARRSGLRHVSPPEARGEGADASTIQSSSASRRTFLPPARSRVPSAIDAPAMSPSSSVSFSRLAKPGVQRAAPSSIPRSGRLDLPSLSLEYSSSLAVPRTDLGHTSSSAPVETKHEDHRQQIEEKRDRIEEHLRVFRRREEK